MHLQSCVITGTVIDKRRSARSQLVARAVARVGHREFSAGEAFISDAKSFRIVLAGSLLVDLDQLRVLGGHTVDFQILIGRLTREGRFERMASSRFAAFDLKAFYKLELSLEDIGPASGYAWTYYQEELVLNAALSAHIDSLIESGSLPSESTLLLAGRSVRIDGEFRLHNCDLVILADSFDGANGRIVLEAPPQATRTEAGVPGRRLTVACVECSVLAASVVGGKGGQGLKGSRGPRGEAGCNTAVSCINGGRGGTGGKGSMGAAGGAGGTCVLRYIRMAADASVDVDVSGGPGGDGGEGGDGGPGGHGGVLVKNGRVRARGDGGPGGATGPAGDPGVSGPIGTSDQQSLADEAFWAFAGDLSSDWPDFRTRVGEYYLRSYNRFEDRSGILARAQNEIDSAVRLSAPLTAVRLQTQLLNSETVLGHPYDLDLIPDFAHYESIVAMYAPLVDSAYNTATEFALQEVGLAQLQQSLQREVVHLQNSMYSLQSELDAANVGLAAAELTTDYASSRVSQFRDLVNIKEQELKDAEVTKADIIIGTGLLIASTITAIVSGGAGLVTVAPAVAYLAGTGLQADYASEIGLPKKERVATNELVANAKDLKNAIEAVRLGYQAFVSFEKMMTDLRTSDDPDSEVVRLLIDYAEAVHEQLLAEMRQAQASLLVTAAAQRLATAELDLTTANAQLASLNEDIETMALVARRMYATAQRYTDELSHYLFMAARAVEIYALEDMTRQLYFDYGYIHPDKEENFEKGFLRLSDLAAEYSASWVQFLGAINYRNVYENYLNAGDWSLDYHRMVVDDPVQLEEFRATGRLSFTVDESALPASRREARVVSVSVALVGATATSGAVSALVRHSGRYTQLRRDGERIPFILRSRATVVLARLNSLAENFVASESDPATLAFWGRGIATYWELIVEPEEIAAQDVDFHTLTAIHVWIGYRCILSL